MKAKQQDIFLVPLPFSNLRSIKKRPVLVISNDAHNQSSPDCLVMAITSKIDKVRKYSLLFTNDDLTEGYLPKKSQLRIDKIYAIDQQILIRRFGRINNQLYQKTISLLEKLVHWEP